MHKSHVWLKLVLGYSSEFFSGIVISPQRRHNLFQQILIFENPNLFNELRYFIKGLTPPLQVPSPDEEGGGLSEGTATLPNKTIYTLRKRLQGTILQLGEGVTRAIHREL